MSEQKTIEKIGNITLNLKHYAGHDFYSDGDVEDELLAIARDLSPVEYPSVIEERGSWPLLYHLSALRENIVDWLPIKKTDKVLEANLLYFHAVVTNDIKVASCLFLRLLFDIL